MIYLFLADGFEEIEALGTIDILRRCGLKVQTLSATGRRVVEGAHGIVVKADSLFRRNHTRDAQALVIPGGSEGARALNSNVLLRQTIAQHASMGTLIAAICAGPVVLANSGVLHMKHVTCYPSLRGDLGNVHFHEDCYAVLNDNILTAAGPAATPAFALTLAEALAGKNVVSGVKSDMLYHLASNNLGRVLYFEGDRQHYKEQPVSPVSQFRSSGISSGDTNNMFGAGADSDELIF